MEISYKDLKCFLQQTVKMFISGVQLDILNWESMGMDSLWEPQVDFRGTAGSFTLASFFTHGGFYLAFTSRT